MIVGCKTINLDDNEHHKLHAIGLHSWEFGFNAGAGIEVF